uniref:Uncharacterized protein n=1 Tax=Oryzias latipes TaxID=8090 RepID=A0A3P9HNR2_ORYLA
MERTGELVHGKSELLVQILTAAERHHVDVSVNGRTSAGYTPLHLAAMQGHLDMLKLLVGAYNADVNLRDYNRQDPTSVVVLMTSRIYSRGSFRFL